MVAISVSHISKSFGSTRAVNDVSFEINQGEIFGLLGPNGAGKTTTIRLLLDIFKPEQGQISILGGPMTEAKKSRIGYMPEERGLYRDVTLERCLDYLGSLKGLSKKQIRTRSADYMERLDLSAHKKKKIKELSKGMQQKAQIIATIMHQPELIIIDEPFTGLDPVNTQLVKDILWELRDQGTTIIMSTHQLHQVEEMCDRILLINRGEAMLYGPVREIRQEFSGHAVLVRSVEEIGSISGVTEIINHNGAKKLILSADTTPKQVLNSLVNQQINLEYFEIAVPTLSEIFIQVVQEQD